jgi:hypothetical protein
MATPTVMASLDKPAYAPGETMILVVDHADTDRATITVTVSVKDTTGDLVTFECSGVVDQATVTVTSVPARVWTLQPGATIGRSVFHAVA